MKIKNSILVETANVLANLQPLKKAPKASFAFGKNLRKLKSLMEDITNTQKALLKEHFGDERPDDHPNKAAYLKAFQDVLDTEVEFEPHKCSEADLNLDENPISPRELASLMWLIEE